MLQEKIMKENIHKAVKANFIKRGIISEGEFKTADAIEGSEKLVKQYMDKMESAMSDGMQNAQAMKDFDQYKRHKAEWRKNKIESIISLAGKIGDKLKQKRKGEVLDIFRREMDARRVEIPENREYERTMVRVPILRQKMAVTQEEFEEALAERKRRWQAI